MIFAAAKLSGENFAIFSLLYLLSISLAGLARGFVFQPGLIHFRTDKRPILSPRLAVTCTLIVAIFSAGGAAWLAGEVSGSLYVYALSATLPVILDWLRHRNLAGERWVSIAVADGLRMVTVPVIALAGSQGIVVATVFNFSYLVSIATLAMRYQRSREYAPYSSFWPQGRAQGMDFLMASLNGVVPMLVLGGIAATPLIGAVRLAQTLLGPLNLVFLAVESQLLASAVTEGKLLDDRKLRATGAAMAARMLVLSSVFVGVIAFAIFLTPTGLFDITPTVLLSGVILAGLGQITGGWAAIYVVLIRALRLGERLAVVRGCAVCAVLAAYFVGLKAGGPEASLIAGMTVSALIYPTLLRIHAGSRLKAHFREI